MFPLHENHMLLFEDLSFLQEYKILQDLLADYSAVPQEGNGNDFISDVAEKRKGTNAVVSGAISEEIKKGAGSSEESKKVTHREVERQRRKEMGGLYSSLKSLLPLEFIKGKRSVSDHMNEAVKFIKHMQAKIEGMRMRRDKIKKLFRSSGGVEQRSNISYFSNCVKVNFLGEELEILISGGEGFPLSEVLSELLGGSFNVVSCLSNRVDEQSLQKIQIQASNLTYDDLSELQQRLVNVIKLA